MNFLKFALLLILFPLLYGCEMINPDEQIPTYIRIDSFQFQPTPNTGTSSHHITSVWVYHNNQTVGVFDLPAVVPVYAAEQGEIMVMPGIAYSGLNGVQVPYPYYLFDTMAFLPAPGRDIVFTPVTRYMTDSLLEILHEDFEFGSSFVHYTGDTMRRVNDPSLVFEGSWSGQFLQTGTDFTEAIMSVPFTVNSMEAFVEINYKSSIHFEVGIQSSDPGGSLFINYLYGFRPQQEWHKIYVGLQEFLSTYPNKQYRLVLKATPNNTQGGFVLVDNIKVIRKK